MYSAACYPVVRRFFKIQDIVKNTIRFRPLAPFFVVALAIVIACSFLGESIPTPTQEPSAAPSPQLTATALAEKAPILATLTAKKDFQWKIDIIQDNVIDADGNEFRLQRKSFAIRIEVSRPIAVYLNAQDTDNNFVKIVPGIYVDDQCARGLHAFCSLVGMTVADVPNELIIDQEYEEALHAFVLNPRLGESGSQFIIGNDSITYERRISFLTLLGETQTIGSSTRQARTEIPLEQFVGEKLYLIFLAKYQEGKILSENELQKSILVFQ